MYKKVTFKRDTGEILHILDCLNCISIEPTKDNIFSTSKNSIILTFSGESKAVSTFIVSGFHDPYEVQKAIREIDAFIHSRDLLDLTIILETHKVTSKKVNI